MNKRGHVGTIMLVIGALFLVIVSLFMMVSSNTDLSLIRSELRASSDFAEANHKYLLSSINKIVVDSINESNNSSDFEKSFNESLKKYASDQRASGLNNNLYAKLSLGQYSLLSEAGNYELVVSDISEKYNLNNNEISYSYSLKIIFGRDKVISVQEFMKESL